MDEHYKSERLKAAMEECLGLAGPFQTDVFRIVPERFANEVDALSGARSKECGGRWTTPGGFATLYCSLEPETPVAEVLANVLRLTNGAPLQADFWNKRRCCRITVALQRVLDLRDEEVQARLGLGRERMRSEPWWELQARQEEAITQAVGRAAWECGLEALLVPSACREEGVNLVIFPENLPPGALRLRDIQAVLPPSES